jgi:hypothetical protein
MKSEHEIWNSEYQKSLHIMFIEWNSINLAKIKNYLEEMWFECTNWINMAQNSRQYRTFVNIGMNFVAL